MAEKKKKYAWGVLILAIISCVTCFAGPLTGMVEFYGIAFCSLVMAILGLQVIKKM